MPGIATIPSPEMRQATLDESFARSMAGMPEAAPEEQQRLQAKQTADATRKAQVEDLAGMLSDRMTQAEEVERSLRESGMADVADRFRRASQKQAFSAARRGLAGGSADLEQQAELRQQAEGEAQGVAEQSRFSALEQVLKAQQTRDRLSQEVLKRDPFLSQAEGEQVAGIGQATEDDARLQAAIRAFEEARRQGIGANVGGIANIVGGLGEGIGNIVGASARGEG